MAIAMITIYIMWGITGIFVLLTIREEIISVRIHKKTMRQWNEWLDNNKKKKET